MLGTKAREEFPGGLLLRAGSFREALRRTARAIEAGATVLFEAAFAHGPVRVRPDILAREEDGGWALWEVKAGSEPRDEYLLDLAVQIHVLEGEGKKVQGGLLLVDREATTESSSIFRRLPCDAEARRRLPLVRDTIESLVRQCAAGEPPPADLARRCRACDHRGECWPALPDHSVLELHQGGGGWRAVEALLAEGTLDLTRLSSARRLTAIQRRQVEAIRSGRPADRGELAGRLAAAVRHPLHFLDFEASCPPLPAYPGQHPFDLIPFQWSCHVVERPGAPPAHHAFLWREREDPRRPFSEALLQAVRPTGSIVVYSGFEKNVIRNMAEIFPDLAPRLVPLEERLFDLLPAIRDHYYHPGFRGSFSIKSVLPVLVPGKGYGALAFSDGTEAVWAYHRLAEDDLGEEERERIVSDLLAYCRQDSLALFEIYTALCDGDR